MSDLLFSDLGLDASLLENVEALGFETPTPIQAEAIPILLDGRDIVGQARTGSGKTAAFGLPLLQRITRDKKIRGLILAPTRELAQQVTQAMRSFDPSVRTFAIYGGTSYTPQLKALRRGVSVIVGTPGRLLDLMDRGDLDLSELEVLVLDEGDQMLKMGFIDDVERIIAATPDTRQAALFSATMANDIKRIADTYLKNPEQISIGGSGPSIDHIEQQWMKVPHRHKLDALIRVLESQPGVPTLVFARTRKSTAEIADALAEKGMGTDALHGNLSQAARERVLSRLRSGRLDTLIATDVAARGLDVEHLELVINLDLPEGPDDYVHRIGRTGRAGRKGRAITFVDPRQRYFVRNVKKRFGITLEQLPVPSDAEVVRQQRQGLEEQLEAIRDEAEADFPAQEAVDRLVASGDWTAEQVAAAALHLLADAHNVELGELPDDSPPEWSTKPSRGHRSNSRRSGSRSRRSGSRRSGSHSGAGNEATLFIAAGRRHGIKVGDIVGALANEVGIPGGEIGRINLLDYKAFVGMSRDNLQRTLSGHKFLELRGRKAKLDEARRN